MNKAQEEAVDKSLSVEESRSDISMEQGEMPEPIVKLLKVILEMAAQGGDSLVELFPEFMASVSFDDEGNGNKSKGKHKRRQMKYESFINVEQSKEVDSLKILDEFWTNIENVELQKKIAKLSGSKEAVKQAEQRDFAAKMIDLCRQGLQSKVRSHSMKMARVSSQKSDDKGSGEADTLVMKLHRFLLGDNIVHVQKWLLPNLEENCRLTIDIVRKYIAVYVIFVAF